MDDERARIYAPDYWAGRASRDAELAVALKALTESRARYGDLEVRAAELEAVIERVKYELMVDGERANHERMWAAEDVLSASPSVVLADRDREVAALALEAAADYYHADSSIGPEWRPVGWANRLRERATSIRKAGV